MKKVPKKYRDSWELHTGLYQIHWKNGVAVEVEVGGFIFKGTKSKKK
mgnify:CR=1 FL=1